MQKLQSSWVLVAETHDGKNVTGDQIKGTVIAIKGSDWTITGNPSVGTSAKGTVTIDATKKPKEIDSVQTDGPDKG